MSRGDLQEMEVGTKQSKTAVNANAKAADAMPKLTTVALPLVLRILEGQHQITTNQMMIQQS